jgi:hypothetical protein
MMYIIAYLKPTTYQSNLLGFLFYNFKIQKNIILLILRLYRVWNLIFGKFLVNILSDYHKLKYFTLMIFSFKYSLLYNESNY